jgi:hypothetical protein
MVEYATWVKVDPLTVKQAARLWAGLDPTALLYSGESARLAPRLQMLIGAIKRGVLPADHTRNALAPSGYYEQSEVSRSDLRAFAESIGERPAFLFWVEPIAPTKPARIVPKVTQAPPPVATVRGGDFVHLRAKEQPEPHAEGRDPAQDGTTAAGKAMAWMAEEMGKRRRTGESRLRDDMVLALRREYPEIGTVEAKDLFSRLPKELKTGAGRKAGVGNSGQN